MPHCHGCRSMLDQLSPLCECFALPEWKILVGMCLHWSPLILWVSSLLYIKYYKYLEQAVLLIGYKHCSHPSHHQVFLSKEMMYRRHSGGSWGETETLGSGSSSVMKIPPCSSHGTCENQTQNSWTWQWMGRSRHWGMCMIGNLFLVHLSCNLGCMFFWMRSRYIDTIKRTKITHRWTHQRGWFGGPNQSPPSWLLWNFSWIQKGLWRFDTECNHTLLKMRILAFLPINPCSST